MWIDYTLIKHSKTVKTVYLPTVCKSRPPVNHPNDLERSALPIHTHTSFAIIQIELNLTQNNDAWNSIGNIAWYGTVKTHIIACGVIITTLNYHPSHVICDPSAQVCDTSAVDLENVCRNSMGRKSAENTYISFTNNIRFGSRISTQLMFWLKICCPNIRFGSRLFIPTYVLAQDFCFDMHFDSRIMEQLTFWLKIFRTSSHEFPWVLIRSHTLSYHKFS